MTDTTHQTVDEEDMIASAVNHKYPKLLDYGSFDDPVAFRVTVEGEPTLIPSYSIDSLFDEKYELVRDESFDVVAYGPHDEEDGMWFGCVFDGAEISNKKTVIDHVDKILENYNEPSEDLAEKQKERWRKSTVIITDVYGVEYEQ